MDLGLLIIIIGFIFFEIIVYLVALMFGLGKNTVKESEENQQRLYHNLDVPPPITQENTDQYSEILAEYEAEKWIDKHSTNNEDFGNRNEVSGVVPRYKLSSNSGVLLSLVFIVLVVFLFFIFPQIIFSDF